MIGAWLSVALLCSGCAKFETARECGVFVPAMNGWLSDGAKTEAPVAADPPAAAADAGRAVRHVAERYDALSREIEALKLDSPALSPKARQYRTLAESAARLLRDVASAVERRDRETARRRRHDFEALVADEAKLVSEINEVCR